MTMDQFYDGWAESTGNAEAVDPSEYLKAYLKKNPLPTLGRIVWFTDKRFSYRQMAAIVTSTDTSDGRPIAVHLTVFPYDHRVESALRVYDVVHKDFAREDERYWEWPPRA